MGAMNEEPAAGSGQGSRGFLRSLGEIVIIAVTAVLLAIFIKTFLVQAFYIPSGSMEPGLAINDRVLVEKPSYWLGGSPERGDVVVFADPGDWIFANQIPPSPSGFRAALSKIGLYPSGDHLVKRVIGVGGDTVECCDSGRILVNGTALDETSFIAPTDHCDGPMTQDNGAYLAGGCKGWKAVVPKGRLFVMGDNRANSADSSFHLCSPKRQRSTDPAIKETCSSAYVPVSDVVGRVAAVFWPTDRFGLEHRPATFDNVD
ncbi:signal peptidase I [Nocardioides albertanoniae]|uniref:Signal peptidase I n=1 Tax=Nocardioides albertanoniae TaxID=1175486 RepID=A0A543A3F7_9ACTN|nr:signal peptidase I [Nocardioides albertanoniae]TQL67094.1 signal peptidase I [Nocardioides albertanoniae]